MQAIMTKYYGPTNTRGSRIKAWCSGGSVSVTYDHALSSEANHDAAALKLVEKMGWAGDRFNKLARGGMETGNVYVWVNEQTMVVGKI